MNTHRPNISVGIENIKRNRGRWERAGNVFIFSIYSREKFNSDDTNMFYVFENVHILK